MREKFDAEFDVFFLLDSGSLIVLIAQVLWNVVTDIAMIILYESW
jgi:hypothetical protein